MWGVWGRLGRLGEIGHVRGVSAEGTDNLVRMASDAIGGH